MNIKRTEAFEKLRQKALQKQKEEREREALKSLEFLDLEVQAIFNQIKKKNYGDRS